MQRDMYVDTPLKAKPNKQVLTILRRQTAKVAQSWYGLNCVTFNPVINPQGALLALVFLRHRTRGRGRSRGRDWGQGFQNTYYTVLYVCYSLRSISERDQPFFVPIYRLCFLYDFRLRFDKYLVIVKYFPLGKSGTMYNACVKAHDTCFSPPEQGLLSS